MTYSYHPFANIFELLEGPEFEILCDALRAAGRLHERIVLFEDKILDGRNRQRACDVTGITAHYRHFDPEKEGSPLDYVWAMNAARRHLSINQRAMAAADLGKLGWGGDRSKASIEALNRTVEKRAEMARVGQSTIERADIVKEQGVPELQDAVRHDRVAVSTAADIATLPEAEQTKVLGLSDKDIIAKAKEIRAKKLAEKQAKNKPAYDADIAQGCTVDDLHRLVAEGKKYAVIYADPPWDYETYSALGKDRSAGQHYDTDPLAGIKGLPVPALAATNAVLLVWCVDWGIPQALELIATWGFEFKTVGFTWIKQNPSGNGLFMGMGHWTRSNAEMCLLATKGKPSRVHADVRQVVMSPLGPHSQKPEEVRKGIERLVHGPYLELYARRTVPNWMTWGNQIKRGAMGEPDSSRATEAGQGEPAPIAMGAGLLASVACDELGRIEVTVGAGNAYAEILQFGNVSEERLEECIAGLMMRDPPIPPEKITRIDGVTGEIMAPVERAGRCEHTTLNGGVTETEVQRGQADKQTAPAPMGSEPKASEQETLASASGEVQGRCEPTSPFIPGSIFDPATAHLEASITAEEAEEEAEFFPDDKVGATEQADVATERPADNARPVDHPGGDHVTDQPNDVIGNAGAVGMPLQAISKNRAAPAHSSLPPLEYDEDNEPILPAYLRRAPAQSAYPIEMDEDGEPK